MNKISEHCLLEIPEPLFYINEKTPIGYIKQLAIEAGYLEFTGAYVQFRGSEFHTRNARSRQLQEQRRAKAG